MNFYDKVNEMSKCFRETDEYKEFIKLKNKIKLDNIVYEDLKMFKVKQAKQQMEYMTNGKVDNSTREELENLYSQIIKNEDIKKLLEQEMKLNIMLADTQKAMGIMVKEIVEF